MKYQAFKFLRELCLELDGCSLRVVALNEDLVRNPASLVCRLVLKRYKRREAHTRASLHPRRTTSDRGARHRT